MKNMSSITSDFSYLTNGESNNTHINQRASQTSIKRTRPCQRRKILTIKPLRLDEIQKEIEEADKEYTRQPPKPSFIEKDKENKSSLKSLEDSFELNFAALSLNTPAKQEITEKFVTPRPEYRSMAPPRNRALDFQYVTPNNKIPPKVQCSVKMQPYIRTPVARLSTVREQAAEDSGPNTSSSIPQDFNKIQVNNVRYIILNELGKGGSSEVFHCYNPEAKTHRAIKIVSLANGNSAAGFIKEVKMLQTLQKCNRIIKMFDYEINEEENNLYVVLEVGGADLSKILKESALNSSHMPLYMLLYYWMEMLYAVRQIHSHGIIHSDLKPANFLKVEGCLKLIDFGIASFTQHDMTSVIKPVQEGSLNYISPEALCNENSSNADSPSFGKPKYKIRFKSDVWSLGCILYQLVYRKTPFQHITQVWAKLATIVNPDHNIEYPDVDWAPSKIINTVKACLQVNPTLRPSVDDLITEYEKMFQNLP